MNRRTEVQMARDCAWGSDPTRVWGGGVLLRRMAGKVGIVQSQVPEGTKNTSGSSVCDYLTWQVGI